jgi:thiamine-phosphate pyrophosphorylase
MMQKKRLLKKPGLYLVTDKKILKGRNLSGILSASLRAGLDMVQLRDKEASDADFFKTGLQIKSLVKNKALLIINDRVHMALALDADGVHLGTDDMPVRTARRLMGNKKIIGFSAHNLEEALDGRDQGADYVAIGAIFHTPVKPDYKKAGLDTLKQVVKNIKIPVVAIGGINESNIEKVRATGVKRIAIVRALLKAGNPYLTAKKLLEKI